MSTCKSCGISDWHPEARTCTATDCELRRPGPNLLRPAAASRVDDRTACALADAGYMTARDYVAHKQAGNGQSHGLIGQVQGIAVHEVHNAA